MMNQLVKTISPGSGSTKENEVFIWSHFTAASSFFYPLVSAKKRKKRKKKKEKEEENEKGVFVPRVQESKSGSFLSSGPSGKRIGGRRWATLVLAEATAAVVVVVAVVAVAAASAAEEVRAIEA